MRRAAKRDTSRLGTLPERGEVVIRRLLERGISAGFPLSRYYADMEKSLLVAVTEKRTKEEIDRYVQTMEKVVR